MFKISVKKNFIAWHALSNYKGSQEAPHEHEWLCEVVFESEKLDEAGCAIDFRKVDGELSVVLGNISGSALLEKKVLKDASCSTENIAKYIYEKMDEFYKDTSVKLTEVKLFEDPKHSATYYVK